MEDDEAEAALFALGSSLMWAARSVIEGEFADVAAGGYSVFLIRSLSGSPVYLAEFQPRGAGRADHHLQECRRRADAKAICEHHAVTGEWLELSGA